MAALAVWIAVAVCLEVALRLQQRFGFSFDQWLSRCEQGGGRSPLNHEPNAGRVRQRLSSAAYGQFAGLEYEERYDERGIKFSALRPQDGEGTRVLFMGDSFIEGYDDANTVPQRAYDWIAAHTALARPLIILNAAYSSYSPLIFTVQAKRLLPVVHPDFVVVDVDETDLYDDAVRYRRLAVRDDRGRVIAVDRDPERLALVEGCARARQNPLLLLRLIATAYYQVRLTVRAWREPPERLFAVAESPAGEIPPELREQMRYFSTTLDELFSTLKEYLPAARILVVRHPHLRHLQRNNRGEPAMNRKVGELVRAAAARNGVTFFDAQDELAARFAGHPERYYWSISDMHFNFDGIRAYSELVGRELLRKLQEASHPG